MYEFLLLISLLIPSYCDSFCFCALFAVFVQASVVGPVPLYHTFLFCINLFVYTSCSSITFVSLLSFYNTSYHLSVSNSMSRFRSVSACNPFFHPDCVIVPRFHSGKHARGRSVGNSRNEIGSSLRVLHFKRRITSAKVSVFRRRTLEVTVFAGSDKKVSHNVKSFEWFVTWERAAICINHWKCFLKTNRMISFLTSKSDGVASFFFISKLLRHLQAVASVRKLELLCYLLNLRLGLSDEIESKHDLIRAILNCT